MDIKTDFNLIHVNTFKLDSFARYFFELTKESDLPALLSFAKEKKLSIKFLGGGSNLILPFKIDALVIKNNLKGISVINETDAYETISCASGENWHEFVLSCLQKGYRGLENLALIPGTVGGAPIQNIGAYGVEVNRFISNVTGFDCQSMLVKKLTNKDCQFEYRNSIFKTAEYKNFFITQVEFQFPKIHKPILNYSELAIFFKDKTPTALEIANKVMEIRRNKLPDVELVPNVGSFFKNPIVSAEKLKLLKQVTPDLISYPQENGNFKLAAGQLIEKMGFKGQKEGTVGMYHKQALVMVNLGHGHIDDIIRLVGRITQECFNQYGVKLEVEPIFW